MYKCGINASSPEYIFCIFILFGRVLVISEDCKVVTKGGKCTNEFGMIGFIPEFCFKIMI